MLKCRLFYMLQEVYVACLSSLHNTNVSINPRHTNAFPVHHNPTQKTTYLRGHHMHIMQSNQDIMHSLKNNLS